VRERESDRVADEGRVALVTGGGKGLGRSISETLLADGWTVAICGRREPETLPRYEGRQAFFETCDVRKPDEIAAMVDRIVERTGRIDLLVNNAGGSPPVAAADASPRFSEAIIALNLLGPLHMARACHPVMARQPGGGSIVNIASISGTRPSPGTAAYGAAKAGLLNLTESLAMEWGPTVRVNALIVGLLDTGTADDDHYGGAEGIARINAMLPMRRMATGPDVAAAVTFLASPAAAMDGDAGAGQIGGGERPIFLDLAATP
jgi:NAD(P)-dependent dehydrogenase (short-subunit alcohol dehydrogenase family)